MAPDDSGDPPSNDPPRDGPPASGEALFLANLKLIERAIRSVCHKKGLSPAKWEDFASHVKLKLIDNGYAVLLKFRGGTVKELAAFLHITITNFLHDYRNTEGGKWRPSADAVRLGGTAILLEQLVVRDGYTFEEAFEIITVNHRINVTRGYLVQLYIALPERTRRRTESAEPLEGLPSSDSADKNVKDEERRRAAKRIAQALQQQLASIPAQDRLILKLHFADRRTVATIARTLRLDQKSLYRRLKRLLLELRTGLEQRGISREDVTDLLGGDPPDEPDNDGGRETGGGGPSSTSGGAH